MYEVKMGRPFSYKPDVHLPRILEAVDGGIALGMIADLAEIPRSTFKDWVKCGDADCLEQKSTELAHMSAVLRKARAEKAKKLIKEAMKGKRNGKFIQWLLKVCFPEDFGQDAEIYKELLHDYKELVHSMNLKEDLPVI